MGSLSSLPGSSLQGQEVGLSTLNQHRVRALRFCYSSLCCFKGHSLISKLCEYFCACLSLWFVFFSSLLFWPWELLLSLELSYLYKNKNKAKTKIKKKHFIFEPELLCILYHQVNIYIHVYTNICIHIYSLVMMNMKTEFFFSDSQNKTGRMKTPLQLWISSSLKMYLPCKETAHLILVDPHWKPYLRAFQPPFLVPMQILLFSYI